MESPIVTLTHASKNFIDGKDTHSVLDSVDFTLATGASVALTGASGSGKSTLLNLIAGFEPLSTGELWLDGENTSDWKDPQWSRFRHQKLGVIFQQFNLLTPLNVKQNIDLSHYGATMIFGTIIVQAKIILVQASAPN